jgi:hypothetical protein
MPGRTICALSAVFVLLTATAAAAQAPTIELQPNVAGHGSRLMVDAHPDASRSNGQDVRSVVLSIARGFVVDPRARAARCGADQAKSFNCPAASKVGSGTAQGHATGAVVPGGRFDFTAQIEAFLAPPPQPGDVAGVVLQVSEPKSGQRGTITARLVPTTADPFGLELRIDNLGGASPAPPGVTITIDRVTLVAGASRTVVRKRRVRRHGRRVTVRTRHRYDLITNPPSCSGAWPFRVTIGYTDHTDSTDGSVACAAR